MTYDLIIIGGGPAGVAAGVYAARKQLKTLFITKDYQSQSAVSPDIQNWIGTVSISGADLAKSLEDHLKAYASEWVDIKEGELGEEVHKEGEVFKVQTDKETYEGRSILITTGSRRRKLEVKGAEEFEHKGITYCATCDGPLFAGKDVLVVGGGNAGFETAAQLLAYAKSVTLFQRSDKYRADPITVKKVLDHPNMTGVTNTRLVEFKGDGFLNEVIYKINDDGKEKSLKVEGVFAEIGSIPNTDLVANVVDRDDYNHIKVDPWTQSTSQPGIWAAGDCTNVKYHQNNIAAGDAVKALEDIYMYLRAR